MKQKDMEINIDKYAEWAESVMLPEKNLCKKNFLSDTCYRN